MVCGSTYTEEDQKKAVITHFLLFNINNKYNFMNNKS